MFDRLYSFLKGTTHHTFLHVSYFKVFQCLVDSIFYHLFVATQLDMCTAYR